MLRQNGLTSLVIADGDVPSMVCAALQSRTGEVGLWAPPLGAVIGAAGEGSIGEVQRAAVPAQARALGLRLVEAEGPAPWPGGRIPAGVVLALAVQDAQRLAARRVVWPIVCGEDLQMLSEVDAVARSAHASIEFDLQAGVSGKRSLVEIELPLADLTRNQVADLAVDLGVKAELSWWHGGSGPAAESASWFWRAAFSKSARAIGV